MIACMSFAEGASEGEYARRGTQTLSTANERAILFMGLLYLRNWFFLVFSMSHESRSPWFSPPRLTLRFPEFCGKPCGKELLRVSTSRDFSNLHSLHMLRG